LLIDSDYIKFKKVLTTAFFLPYAIPTATASLMWCYIFNPRIGPYSGLFKVLGMNMPNFFSPALVGYAIVNIATWKYAGYNTILLLSTLTTISPELYEAAAIDGASARTIAFRIKIPMVRNVIFMIMILSTIGWFQLFTEPFFLQIAANLPINYTPNMYVVSTAFRGMLDVPYASSMSLVFAIVLFAISYVIFLKTTKVQLTRER